MTVGSYFSWAYASDCVGRYATSLSDLRTTDFKFDTRVTSYMQPRGWDASGNGKLSSNNQVLTVLSKGWCGHTYIENSPYRSKDLIQIQFVEN